MDAEKEKPQKLLTPFTTIAVIIFVLVIVSNFYFLYFNKEYEFIVESPCDISLEQCVQRDCTDPDSCPPNGLQDFKRYSLTAVDFKSCENEDCTFACTTGLIECEQLECEEDIDFGEFCSSPIINETNE